MGICLIKRFPYGPSVYFYPKETTCHLTEAEFAFHLLLCTSSRFFLALTGHFQRCGALGAMQNEASSCVQELLERLRTQALT